jgi:hypothetical protein
LAHLTGLAYLIIMLTMMTNQALTLFSKYTAMAIRETLNAKTAKAARVAEASAYNHARATARIALRLLNATE